MTETALQLDSQTRLKIRTHLSPYKASEMMREVSITISPDDTLSDVLSVMMKYNMGEIPVVQGKKLVGVVSRNFLIKRRDLPLSTKAKTIMVNHPKLEKDTGIIEMSGRFVSTNARQLFVLENNVIIGMVSREDVINVIPKIPELTRILTDDFMSVDLQYVFEKDSVAKAIEMMNELDTPVIPVVNTMLKPQGFLGLKNLYDVAIVPDERTTVGDKIGRSVPTSIEVSSIMTKPPLTLDVNSTLGSAVNTMLDKSVSTLIAVDNEGKTEGILTVYDLLHLLASLHEREQVYVQISGLGGEDSFYLDDVYMEVEDFIGRVKGIVDLHGIDLHYDSYHKGGDNRKYSTRVRIMTNKGIYHSSASDWSPSKTASEVFYHLERQIKTEKDLRITRRHLHK